MNTGLRALSLYAGAGGLDHGFHLAGVETVWANEFDPDAAATYRALLPDTELVVGDIASATLPSGDGIDIVIGGPPCQGFSVAGRMDPDDPRSKQVWEFLRVVSEVRPRAFVMENVKSLAVNTRWTHVVARFRRDAEALGYRTHVHVLNAADYAVPQARERMFLVGFVDADPVLPLPAPSEPVSVRTCLAGLPPYGSPGNDRRCTAMVTPARIPVLRKSPYAGMLFNGQGRPMDPDQPAPTLPASMGGNRTPILDQEHLDGGEPWVPGYHAHLMAGKPPLPAIPARLRRLTVEEAAALQTFPLDMRWSGRRNSVFRQIGNAVPPLLARAVGRAVAERLAEASGGTAASAAG